MKATPRALPCSPRGSRSPRTSPNISPLCTLSRSARRWRACLSCRRRSAYRGGLWTRFGVMCCAPSPRARSRNTGPSPSWPSPPCTRAACPRRSRGARCAFARASPPGRRGRTCWRSARRRRGAAAPRRCGGGRTTVTWTPKPRCSRRSKQWPPPSPTATSRAPSSTRYRRRRLYLWPTHPRRSRPRGSSRARRRRWRRCGTRSPPGWRRPHRPCACSARATPSGRATPPRRCASRRRTREVARSARTRSGRRRPRWTWRWRSSRKTFLFPRRTVVWTCSRPIGAGS